MGKIEFSLSFKMVQKYENPEKILTIRKNPDISKKARIIRIIRIIRKIFEFEFSIVFG